MSQEQRTHRAMRVEAAGGAFTEARVETGEPGPGQVRIAVEACGVCHSDTAVVSGAMGNPFPITTGHEIAGRIDALGAGVDGWAVGDRVAVGWYGGSCGHCDACRTGDGVLCPEAEIPGIAYPGGYAESVLVPAVALAAVPDGLSAVDAAPLACAGVTVYNALRRSAARAGDTVAILGLGGLGHLGVQFAAKMGFRTVAIARGAEKGPLATELGAAHYIDSTTQDVAAELQALGGAKVVLATVTQAQAMADAFEGLGRRGELVIVGVALEHLDLTAAQFVDRARRVYGHASGIAVDTQDTLRFAADTGVRPWTEERPLAEADEAFARMRRGEARFRMVLTV
ncbi:MULTISPECIES: alcohol dehydrogenase catalytic domain-containing protein [unclassified Streptomyces]|uniref:alcohol dehydrogenase catalytic domain-containing protein n=1 Tax=unclassified Streptomyces TaxID=2593676 RepID=UPI00081D4502|nr:MULTISPECIES: alcohol dehydrogenase catalytic domain-containing protein [unclassified Streptomyces]MYR26532.1 alcohol dehydrogenase catalytic domain-containing protein [Streptomyces sp. SID4945]SCF05489.1 alcohol dehydrogenase [Streptomyces sp. LcepLS]